MKNMSKTHTPRILLLIVVVSFLLVSTGVIMAESGVGPINALAFAKNDAIVDKTTTDTTQVPQMIVTFSGRNYALVRFTANGNMFGTGTGAVQVSAKLDGVQIGDEIQFFNYADSAVAPRCFEWPTAISAGTHTVAIYWRITKAAGATLTGRFHDSVLSVLYCQ